MECFVCGGGEECEVVSQMTDGRYGYAVCDACRTLVMVLFQIHGSLSKAVLEAAQALRGKVQS